MSGDGKRGGATRPSSTLQIKGKKRHLLVDTQGLLMCAIGHAADIQDRDGGLLLRTILSRWHVIHNTNDGIWQERDNGSEQGAVSEGPE
jgi:hypothetical protein